jgi:hypothetical protein
MYKGGNWLLIQGAAQGLVSWGGTDTGVANAYVVALTNQYFSYQAGNTLFWIPSATNTGASTINVKGLGAQSILGPGGAALVAGQIAAGVLTEIVYTGTAFRLVTFNFISGAFSLTVSGCTTTPTVTVNYAVNGNLVIAEVGVPGGGSLTSNSTAFAYTGWPAQLRSNTLGHISGLFSATDNSVAGIAATASIENALGSTSLHLNINNSSGLWTASGTKGVNPFTFTYFL